jgi:hypothetical protein
MIPKKQARALDETSLRFTSVAPQTRLQIITSGKNMINVLLISTYDLGHQPFGLASPAAWLAAKGVRVDCLDLPFSRWMKPLLCKLI